MFLQIKRDQHLMLLQLVENRIDQLHPEIRRCPVDNVKQRLEKELDCLRRLLRQLHEAECDVTA